MFHDCLWGANFSPDRHVSYVMLGDHHPPPDQGSSRWNEIHHHPVETFIKTLGPWAHWLYLAGAFGVIYSTMATIYDGYAGTINKLILICAPDRRPSAAVSHLALSHVVLYGTLANFFLVYMFNAVPVDLLAGRRPGSRARSCCRWWHSRSPI